MAEQMPNKLWINETTQNFRLKLFLEWYSVFNKPQIIECSLVDGLLTHMGVPELVEVY